MTSLVSASTLAMRTPRLFRMASSTGVMEVPGLSLIHVRGVSAVGGSVYSNGLLSKLVPAVDEVGRGVALLKSKGRTMLLLRCAGLVQLRVAWLLVDMIGYGRSVVLLLLAAMRSWGRAGYGET